MTGTYHGLPLKAKKKATCVKSIDQP